MLNICTKFRDNIFDSFNVIEETKSLHRKSYKRDTVANLMFHRAYNHVIPLYNSGWRFGSCSLQTIRWFIFVPKFVTISSTVLELRSQRDLFSENYKGA